MSKPIRLKTLSRLSLVYKNTAWKNKHNDIIVASGRVSKLRFDGKLITIRLPERKKEAQELPSQHGLDDNPEAVSNLSKIFSSLSGGAREAVAVAQTAFADTFPDSELRLVRRLPRRAPMLYEDRDKGYYKDPRDFLEDVWGDYIRDGVLFLDDLNRLDPKLAPAIKSYCQRMRVKPGERAESFQNRDHLPPTSRVTLDNLSHADPSSPEAGLAKRLKDGRERLRKHYRNREP